MKISRKQFLESSLALAGAAAGLAACASQGTGAPGAPGGPSGKLTSCGAQVSIVNDHTHEVEVPASDVNAGRGMRYQTSVVAGHSHELVVTATDMRNLKMGMPTSIETMEANRHTHTVEIACT